MFTTLIVGLVIYWLSQIGEKTNHILYLGAGLILITGGLLATPLFGYGFQFKIGEFENITSTTSGSTTTTIVEASNVYESNIIWNYLMPLIELLTGLVFTLDAAVPLWANEREQKRTTFNKQ